MSKVSATERVGLSAKEAEVMDERAERAQLASGIDDDGRAEQSRATQGGGVFKGRCEDNVRRGVGGTRWTRDESRNGVWWQEGRNGNKKSRQASWEGLLRPVWGHSNRAQMDNHKRNEDAELMQSLWEHSGYLSEALFNAGRVASGDQSVAWPLPPNFLPRLVTQGACKVHEESSSVQLPVDNADCIHSIGITPYQHEIGIKCIVWKQRRARRPIQGIRSIRAGGVVGTLKAFRAMPSMLLESIHLWVPHIQASNRHEFMLWAHAPNHAPGKFDLVVDKPSIIDGTEKAAIGMGSANPSTLAPDHSAG
ncbi:hypothetical protein FB45DRAFT_1011428 [Roridomyces roridus]|uniref:Uncharacterized protein n=1 Tax=Roridomyces roridus TaxID=1738132 RepID=A0AAD7B1I0_9AGAR|nr:hypothetical protein FB45DRAFT_1011428 [Roridomyces roridus]